jgi:hypothetical protein
MRRLTIVTTAVVSLGLLLAVASSASAETLSPWWHVTLGSRPSVLPAARAEAGKVIDGEGEVYTTILNTGDATASFKGSTSPVRILDTLPPGVVATKVDGTTPEEDVVGQVPCTIEESGSRVSCEFVGGTSYKGEINGLPPFSEIEVRIRVRLEPAASGVGEQNEVSVSGGEGSVCEKESEEAHECARVSTGSIPAASVKRVLRVGGEPTRFSIETSELTFASSGGAADTQAGSHPFATTFTTVLNQGVDEEGLFGHLGGFAPEQTPYVEPVGLAKDVRYKLPPGLVGDPSAIPQCPIGEFLGKPAYDTQINECSADTAIGVVTVTYDIGLSIVGTIVETVPLFNLEPAYGEPARFGFYLPTAGFGVYFNTSVETGSNYAVISTVPNIPDAAAFISNEVTFWGTPGSPAHDNSRGWGCLYAPYMRASELEEEHLSCGVSGVSHPAPLLSLPTSCTDPLRMSIEADSWQEPGHYTQPLYSPEAPLLDGCNKLPFVPEIKVTPDGQEAAKPMGLSVDVHVPQEGQLNGEGLAQSNIRDITVKLPAGVVINPSSGDGLQACSSEASALPAGLLGSAGDQVGYQGMREFEPANEPGVKTSAFTRYLPGSFDALGAGFNESLQPGVDFCPDGSKVATVKFKTPFLPHALEGAAYLATQESNPFGSVIAMYIVAEDPVSGSLVKLPGEVQLCKGAGEVIAGMSCEALGQLVATFEGDPQLPFEDAELHFFGGERAPLATPSRCGTYTTEASYVPWSGSAPVKSSSSFEIDSGPNHSRCVYSGEALPFAPTLTGGALSVNAGWFSPFDATFSRLPGEQNMQSIEVRLPPGLSAILTGVELCPEPQANLGECGPNSLIGETTVGVGVGGEPYTVSGGKFYLTGPYDGSGACTVGESGCAPFGVTFEIPAKAGPFDFADTKNDHPACDCVLVRGKVEVNPITAAITIASNPSGTVDSIPTSIEGVPLEIQHVNAITTRNDFQFNPTNCGKMQVTGTIHSSEGASDTIDVPFQVTNCALLAFKPSFEVSTSGKTSRADGASLHVLLSYPKAVFGSQANIKSVKVDLPKQLPSRLPTLQHACPAKTFEANPASCPAESIVGHAKAITPLIPVPLTGPAYFVSYGDAKFPELVIVLQGYGVTLDVHGETFINEKTSVTSSTFHTIPDAPVGSFELTLPQGKYSALAANTDLCKVKKLTMPTAFVAQNGMEIHESTPIKTTGCAKHKNRNRARSTIARPGVSQRASTRALIPGIVKRSSLTSGGTFSAVAERILYTHAGVILAVAEVLG